VCGRFCQMLQWHEIRDLFGLADGPAPPDHQLRYNGAPTRDFAVCRAGPDQEPALDRVRWGLIPSWSRQRSTGSGMINARSETLTQKPSFRAAFRQRRCLIPANGWFEWKRAGTDKEPHYIKRESGKPTVFAGLWERGSADGATPDTFTIITREATPAMQEIHGRQPVVVGSDDFATWLHASGGASVIDRILTAAPPRFLARRVSRDVNDPRNDNPGITTWAGAQKRPSI